MQFAQLAVFATAASALSFETYQQNKLARRQANGTAATNGTSSASGSGAVAPAATNTGSGSSSALPTARTSDATFAVLPQMLVASGLLVAGAMVIA